MQPKTQAPGTLRPKTPKPRGISRKVTLGLTATAAAGVLAAFVLDPGFNLQNAPPAQSPMLSNVRPDLSGLPSDYREMQTASMAVPAAPPAPNPTDFPLIKREEPIRQSGPAKPKPRKIRAGIAVGGDDGIDQANQGSGGVQTVADTQRYPDSAAYDGMNGIGGGGTMGGGGGMAGMGGGGMAGGGRQPRTAAQGFRQDNGGDGEMYLPRSIQNPLGEYEIWPGTIIPAKLASATNSELGGNVVARVSADIYDNKGGRCKMIPRDSTVFGKLSDEVTYGQRRQQAVWSMLILPNGQKLSLMGMDATDGAGRSGITANVNNHYGRLAVAAIAATALDVLSDLARDDNNGTQVNIGGAAANNVTSIGDRIIQRELNVPPNLEQIIGHPVSLMVDRTIVMGCYNDQ
jgi:type IV secretory pathway VirB10-like protein